MEKNIVNYIVILLVVIFLVYGFVSLANVKKVDHENLIHVTGNAEELVKPDMAYIYVTISVLDKNPNNAKKEADELYKELQELGLKMETINYALYPKKRYIDENDDYKTIGYIARYYIKFSVFDLNKVGDYLNKLTMPNVEVNDIYFALKKETNEKIRLKLYSKAVKNAREKAEALAKGLNVKLKKPVAVNISNYSPFPVYRLAKAEADSVNISPTDKKVSVSVSVDFSYE